MVLLTIAVLLLGCENPANTTDDPSEADGGSSPITSVLDLTATTGDQDVVLAWSDPPEDNLSRLEVTWNPDGTDPQAVDPGVETYTASGLINGNEYTFSVVAIDTTGRRSDAATITATPNVANSSGDTANDGSGTDTDPLEASKDANLASLTVDGEPVGDFDPNTTSYTVTKPAGTSSGTVAATSADSAASVSGDVGVQSLQTGANTFVITVIAEDGVTQKQYALTITVEASALTQLSDLQVDSVTVPGFSPTVYSYTVSTSAGTSEATIAATTADEGATVLSGTGSSSVSPGTTPLTVVVEAQNGDQATYTIVVEVPPEAPTALTVSEGTEADRVAVNWTAVAGADSYGIYRRPAGSTDPWGAAIDETSDTSFEDSSAEAASGTLYEYEVTAVADTVESVRSDRDSGYAGDAVTIAISFANPNDPVLSIAGSNTVPEGTNLELTVDSDYSSYTWYVNGDQLPGAADTITIDTSSLYLGTHSVAVVVSDGTNQYSAQFAFTVER